MSLLMSTKVFCSGVIRDERVTMKVTADKELGVARLGSKLKAESCVRELRYFHWILVQF